jgi:hypothetical protein
MNKVNSSLFALVVGGISDGNFNFYVVRNGKREILVIANDGRVGMDFGSVDHGVAYVRAGSSPRNIGRVKYYDKGVYMPRESSRAIEKERDILEQKNEVDKDEKRLKRTYE